MSSREIKDSLKGAKGELKIIFKHFQPLFKVPLRDRKDISYSKQFVTSKNSSIFECNTKQSPIQGLLMLDLLASEGDSTTSLEKKITSEAV